MKKRNSFRGALIPIITAILCIFVALAGCKGQSKSRSDKSAVQKDIAEAKQRIATPSLSPPAGESPAILAPADQPPAPKGPITLSPETSFQPPTALPATPPVVESAGTPPAPSDLKSIPAPAPLALEGSVETPEQITFTPRLIKSQTDVEIVLDASGSMAAPLGSSSATKFDVMKQAFNDVVASLEGASVNLGVRVFGSKSIATDGNREDTELLLPMGAVNQDSLNTLRQKLDILKPQGLSPIAYAISEVSKDFPTGGDADQVLVLLVDGADNTEGDICGSASKLEEGVKKTIINVIAFDVSPQDKANLECLSPHGKLMFARNENELRRSLEEAVNAAVPYNIKITAMAGQNPLPFEITVFKSGQMTPIKRDKSFGTKLLQLEPGAYDIQVDYVPSPSMKKFSKIIKGIETSGTTKFEQSINFELGELTLTALNADGAPAPARFDFRPTGETQSLGGSETIAAPMSVFLPPGSYDISGELLDSQVEGFQISETGVNIVEGESIDKIFRFQKGELKLKGVTTQKENIPFVFQIFKGDKTDELVASGALAAEGGSVQLSPGMYSLQATGILPGTASPRTFVSGINVESGGVQDITINFEMSMIKLSALDGQGNKLPAEFILRDHETQAEMANVKSENGDPISTPIPPGTYDIVASSLKSKLDPKPSVPMTNIVVAADKPSDLVIKFVLGTLRLRGRNAKEQPIQTQFTIYKAGSDEKVSAAPTSDDWMVFDLAPGRYDALAINSASTDNPQPMIWLRDIKVDDGKTTSHETIFTAGKLRMIGRGPNNEIIKCHFKVFQYGKDSEIISGVTSDDWVTYEIPPNSYYIEESYHDDAKAVLLKKWINIKVGENEVLEEICRF